MPAPARRPLPSGKDRRNLLPYRSSVSGCVAVSVEELGFFPIETVYHVRYI